MSTLIIYVMEINIQEGNIYYLDTLPNVILSSISDDSIVVKLSVFEEQVYEGRFVKDFNNSISFDIYPIIESFLQKPCPPIPNGDVPAFALATNLILSCSIEAGNLIRTFIFKGMNSSVADRVSNITGIRVPKNYIPILSATFNNSWKFIEFRTATGMIISREVLQSFDGDQQSVLIGSFKLPNYFGALHVVFSGDGTTAPEGPIYRVCAEDFEQYAFSNEFGGYDNIPMSGILEFSPKVEFQNIVTGKYLKAGSTKSIKEWKQNSGFLTKDTMEEVLKLICGKDSYHLSNGEWRQIVITDCNISHKSTDSLHSLTFTYRYADEI